MSCEYKNRDYGRYQALPVNLLLRHREQGSSANIIQKRCFRSRNANGPTCDFELLRSLYCAENAYLEVVACRKVQRSKAPSFSHGRLFTNSYRTWFNLFTGPTSGPRLMCSDILPSAGPRCQILCANAIFPPYNCSPPDDGAHRGAQLLLLTKCGWLYQADLEDCTVVDKYYIPTKYFATDFRCDATTDEGSKTSETSASSYNFNYHYITVNRDTESVVIKSTRTFTSDSSAVAFCLLGLYPLSLQSHFVVTVASPGSSPPMSADVVNDMLVVSYTRASIIKFFSLNDVISEFAFDFRLHLKQPIDVPASSSDGFAARTTLSLIGNKEVGIPFTTRYIRLTTAATLFQTPPCIFKASCIRHSLQIGGVPYQYLVPANKKGTEWKLRPLAAGESESSVGHKIEISSKWDSSHWQSVHFTADDTGRIVKTDANSLEMLKLEMSPPRESEQRKKSAGRSGGPTRSRTSRKKVELTHLTSGFCIDVSPEKVETNVVKWQYPNQSLTPHTVTSSGRPIRRPRAFAIHSWLQRPVDDEPQPLLVGADQEIDLNLLALLYYRPTGNIHQNWEIEEEGAELVVSVFDNLFGKLLATFPLESDVSPYDRDSCSVLIDQDTFVFTRLAANDNRLQYKVLRLNRRFGCLQPDKASPEQPP